MEITETTLQRFTTWLTNHGRSDGTASVYCSHLNLSAQDGSLTKRLVSRELSPNTRHTNMAALRAWAKFTKDSELRDQLDEIRLPPARRIRPKVPITVEAWRTLAQHLATCKLRSEPLRYVLLIIVKRGLRCSDALRIRRKEIDSALVSGILGFEAKGRKRSEFSAAPIRAELELLAKTPGRWTTVGDLISPDGKHASRAHRVYRTLRDQAAKAGIAKSYPHQMRRTYATNFLRQLHGDPQALVKLQKHMDWGSLSTAAMYSDAVDVDELNQAGERMVEEIFR